MEIFLTFFYFCKPKLFFQEVKNHTSKLTLRSEARASQKWTKILIKSFHPWSIIKILQEICLQVSLHAQLEA